MEEDPQLSLCQSAGTSAKYHQVLCSGQGKGGHTVGIQHHKCKLNEAVWSPNFGLPIVDSITCLIESNTCFGDTDAGKMFLYYPLDVKIHPCVGVDIIMEDEKQQEMKHRFRWDRTLTGFKTSQYLCNQLFLTGEEIIRGNPHDPNNPFCWHCISLNLPGNKSY
eukprot:11577688-Ditylum_brightwellii.AAC.1